MSRRRFLQVAAAGVAAATIGARVREARASGSDPGDVFVLTRSLTGPYYQPLPPEARRPDGEVIRFGPGRAEHTWTDLRGAQPKLDALSVYLTGFTPFRATLRIG